MRTDHANGVAGLPLLADGECDDGRAISGEVVLSAGLQGGRPRVALLGCNRSVLCVRPPSCLQELSPTDDEMERLTLICLKPAFSRRFLDCWTAWKA